MERRGRRSLRRRGTWSGRSARRLAFSVERHGAGAPAGLQNRSAGVARRWVGSIPAPLRFDLLALRRRSRGSRLARCAPIAGQFGPAESRSWRAFVLRTFPGEVVEPCLPELIAERLLDVPNSRSPFGPASTASEASRAQPAAAEGRLDFVETFARSWSWLWAEGGCRRPGCGWRNQAKATAIRCHGCDISTGTAASTCAISAVCSLRGDIGPASGRCAGRCAGRTV